MKALLISGIYRPEIGGPATYLPKLANQLLEEGIQVEVVTLKNSTAKIFSEPWTLNYIVRDQNILIRVIKTALLIAKKSKKVDTVFANGLFQETALGLLFSKRNSVAKVVGDPVWERARNKGLTNLNIIDFNHSKLSLNQKIQRSFLSWSLNRFSVITCPSLELKNLIRGWGVKKPIEFIPNGVSVLNENTDTKEFDLISVSRLVSWKNIDKLIKASAKAGVRLAVVGDGPEGDNLKKLAGELGAPVNFFGQLSEVEVTKILIKSKVFALISDYEGLSFALLSAMASGLPSVVSNIKGNTDVIKDQVEGLVVDNKNQQEIESAIVKLLNSNQLLLEYGKAAKQKVSNLYDQRSQIGKVIELMKVK
jgi:glycosyltransferase involved in cell wall biosynthesis